MADAVTFQLFAKAPVAGAVKTRLQPALDAEGAAALYRRLVTQAATAVAGACGAIGGAGGELWCSPDAANPFLRDLADKHALRLREQASADLGTRMQTALAAAMPGRALLLGSDCPLLDAEMLVAATRALDRYECVLVPAEDGGYALIGCRDSVPDCFDGIAWSTGGVMIATRACLAARGTRWFELPPVWDVDTAAELARLARDVRFSHLLDGLVRRTAAEYRLPGEVKI